MQIIDTAIKEALDPEPIAPETETPNEFELRDISFDRAKNSTKSWCSDESSTDDDSGDTVDDNDSGDTVDDNDSGLR